MRRNHSLGATLGRCAIPLVLALAVASAPADGQARTDARTGMTVSPEWLQANLSDPNLVLLHVGERPEFDREHIPGARFIALDDVSLPRGEGANALTLQMAPAQLVRSTLEGLGVSDGSRIVVYHAGGSVTPATRIVFALEHAGLGAQTSLLNGGLQAWKRQGGRVTSEVVAPARGSLSARPASPLVVDAEWVRDRLRTPGFAVVDARAREFYDGRREGGPRLGHIAGAVNLPFSEVTDEGLRFLDAERLRSLFESAGVRPGDSVVAYCHIGQQATAILFAARLLGYDVRLYDGSFQEWSRRPELPVEVPR